MKVLLNLTNDTLEYQDTKVFIQGTDARNQIIVYADEDITFTNLTIAYQLQNGRTTIAMSNEGNVESDSGDYIEGYTGYIFPVPLSVTTLTGNIMATVVANISGAKHKFNVLNTVIDSVFFEAYETALEEAESEFATNIEAMQSAIVQLQQEQALGVLHPSDIVDNDESDDPTKILSARMGKVLAERIGAVTSGIASASYNTETGILTLTYDTGNTFSMKVGLDTEDIESMASDILADVNDDLDDYKAEVNQSLDDMTETIEGLGNLQPSGTDTSTNILAFTTNKGIYIGSDTGHWYYWSGTQYVDGGVYQAVSIGNGTIDETKLSNSLFNKLGFNSVFDENNLIDGFINNGSIIIADGWKHTDYIPVEYGNIVYFALCNGIGACALSYYDENHNYLGQYFGGTTYDRTSGSFKIENSNIAYVIYNVFPTSIISYNNQYLLIKGNELETQVDETKTKVEQLDTDFKIFHNNYYDNNNLTNGYIINSVDGQPISNQYTPNYAITDFIPINYGDIIDLAYVRGHGLCGGALYDENQNFLMAIWGTDDFSQPLYDFNTKFTFVNTFKNAKYLRYNVQPNSVFSRDNQYIYITKNKTFETIMKYNERQIFYVDQNLTYGRYNAFETLKSVTEYIQNNDIHNAIVYVSAGTYDLVNEFGQTYLDNISSDTNRGFGLKIGNNTHFVFSKNANVVFNYQGTNVDCAEYFSAFNVYGSFTLENANIEVTNARYCVHEDIPTSTTTIPNEYTAKYINCNMKHNGNTIGTYNATICIGAGVNKNSTSIIDGGTYENDPNSFNFPISYHNYYGNYKSKIIAKNVYLKNGGFRLSDFGTNYVDVEITNCRLPNGYSTGTTYFNVIAWNNVN